MKGRAVLKIFGVPIAGRASTIINSSGVGITPVVGPPRQRDEGRALRAPRINPRRRMLHVMQGFRDEVGQPQPAS